MKKLGQFTMKIFTRPLGINSPLGGDKTGAHRDLEGRKDVLCLPRVFLLLQRVTRSAYIFTFPGHKLKIKFLFKAHNSLPDSCKFDLLFHFDNLSLKERD